ncbi:MAG: lytic transglycosylase domain-containing protein [Magnetococcales bacterium]|nr:lytic transglycosylase domain-containing protein [Magnetococcales bacterium]MBF0584463.1 lytic transglycosylase domain-containing protein [Magnetococcales bacterium]
MVRAAAQRTGLSTALLHSIIRAESNFDPNAVSPKGAAGLMQLMPETARLYGVTDITDPETNIHGGALFLADLLKQFNNNLELSLAAYNAGPTTVTRYGRRVPPYPETRNYIARVLRYYEEYQKVM